jgi:hypothetical protein
LLGSAAPQPQQAARQQVANFPQVRWQMLIAAAW